MLSVTCKHGHVLDASNTRLRSNGARACRACDRRRKRPEIERPVWDEYAVDDDSVLVTDDAVANIYGAMVKQAWHDYLRQYRTARTPDALAFLQAAGLADASGEPLLYGHVRAVRRGKP